MSWVDQHFKAGILFELKFERCTELRQFFGEGGHSWWRRKAPWIRKCRLTLGFLKVGEP